ncbi:S1C family serine protease [Candidatus Latescibacterota bacterium]
MNAYIKTLAIVLSILGFGLGLTGCASTMYQAQRSPEQFSLRFGEKAVRIEVPMPSETLLDRYSIGTGFLLSSNTGVTCFHVVNGRVKDKLIKAYIAGQEHDLKIVGENVELDIVVFRIDPPVSTKLVLQKSDVQLDLGQMIQVLGFPLPSVILDKYPSVTGGIVSGLNRSIICDGERIDGLIQVDAVSSNGNSGGPVITIDGRSVGMVVFAATGQRAEWRGATFALPIKVVEEAAQDIIDRATHQEKRQSKEMSGPSSVKNLITK